MFFYSRFSILLMVLYGISPSMQANIIIGQRVYGDVEMDSFTISKPSSTSVKSYTETLSYNGNPITYIWGFDNSYLSTYSILEGQQNSTSYKLLLKNSAGQPIQYDIALFGFKINPDPPNRKKKKKSIHLQIISLLVCNSLIIIP